MPDPLPFEYHTRWRDLAKQHLPPAVRRLLEQKDRELEDYLKNAGGSGTALQAGAKWRNADGGSDATFDGGFLQPIWWGFSPVSYSDGYFDFVHNEGGETYDRIHIYTPGYYSATVFAFSDQGGPFIVRIVANTAAGSGESFHSFGLDASSDFEGTSYGTAFTAHAMAAGDYFHAGIKGTADDTFAAFITVEYVAPFGGATEVIES